MTGCWVMVCGPSGAGKDSVLAWAQAALPQHPRIVFARRLVTRAAQPGSDHEQTSPAAMQALRTAGGLAWYWHAHGLGYGVRSDQAALVEARRVVVVNASREHVLSIGKRADVRCVLVTAPPSVLAARLQARGREDAQAIAGRLQRNAALAQPAAHRVIRNDGDVATAGSSLRDYLLQLAE